MSLEDIEVTHALTLKEANYSIKHELNPTNGDYTVKDKNNNKLFHMDRFGVLKPSYLHQHIQSKTQEVKDVTDAHDTRITALENANSNDPGIGRIDQVLGIGNDADGYDIVGLGSVEAAAVIIEGSMNVGDLLSSHADSITIIESDLNNIKQIYYDGELNDFPSSFVTNLTTNNNTIGYLKGELNIGLSCIEFNCMFSNVDNVNTIITVNTDHYNTGDKDIDFVIDGPRIKLYLNGLTETTRYKLLYKLNEIEN